MSNELAYQRCANHAEREAVARCPECRRYFCRECITEHDRRVLCASCLQKLGRRPLLQQRALKRLIGVGQCLLGLLAAWFFFYLVGEALLALPTSFHEGTIWKSQAP